MSTSRLEKFIYAICSMEVSDLPTPLSRIEILWNCLITGETPDFEPQSRNEQYLMAMLGLYELNQLPTPMSRGEKLLYKIAMGETDLSDIPAYLSRYEELLGYLAENGGIGTKDFEYILQILNQRLSTLYSTKEQPMKQAVIKGDTLVNELPRPSLKNTMTNVASQKMNQGYDNGKTLVNLASVNETTLAPEKNIMFESTLYKTSTIYTIIFECIDFVNNGQIEIRQMIDNTALKMENFTLNKGTVKIKITTTNQSLNKIRIKNLDTSASLSINRIMILEGNYTNEDIPYFEGTKTFSATPNVVDGEFKQAVVKGQTLVNIKGEETFENDMVSAHHDFLIPSVKKNTDYLIKYDTTLSGGVLAIGFLKNNNIWSKNLEKQPNVGIIKLNSGDNPNYFRLIGVKDVTLSINNLMIIEYQDGMENWDIPYFEGMQSVQLSEVTTENVKNLINKQTMQRGYIDEYGTLQSNDNDLASDYIKITPNKYYTYQVSSNIGSTMRFSFFDKSKNIVARTTTLNASDGKYATYIAPSNAYYVRTHSNNFKNIGFNPDLISLVEGDKPLSSYEYQSNTLTLAEPVNLRKVGDVEDEFDALTGQVTENLIEVSVNASINIKGGPQAISGHTNTSRYTIRINDTYGINVENNYGLSDKIPCKNNDDDDFHFKIGQQKNTCFIYVPKNELETDDWDGFVKWANNKDFKMVLKRSTNLTKTVNPTITDQDGATQTKLHSFNDGHLSVSSQGLFPSAVNYEVPTNNSYYLPDMLTLGAQYTSRGSADCNATIDGKLLALGKNRTFTTPSSVTDRLMVLDAPVDDLMFIKGDQTAKDFGYFEGMKSIVLSNKMPVLSTIGKNLLNYSENFEVNHSWYGKSLKSSSVTIVDNKSNLHIKNDDNGLTKGATYSINVPKNTVLNFGYEIIENSGNSKIHIFIHDDNKSFLYGEQNNTKNFITYNSNSNEILNVSYMIENIGEVVILPFISTATSYEPYKSNILTVNEDVTLRGIGDVKDELNCLTSEVTEHIGGIVFSSSDDFQYLSEQDDGNFSSFAFIKDINRKSGYNGEICDRLKRLTNYLANENGIYYYGRDGRLELRLDTTNFISRDLNGLNDYLSKNPITLQYFLATPTIKTVDLTTVDQDGQPMKLKTFNDISYVEIGSDNIIPSVDVEVATKISETLSTLGLEHHDISNTQNQLGQTINEQTENTDATMMATTEIYEQTL